MRRYRRDLAVLGLFVLLAVIHTWPLARNLPRQFVAHPDVFSNIWALNELARAVLSHPLRPFDGNIFYPYAQTLAIHDHHVANLLFTIPLRMVTDSPTLVYNIVFLASFVLSGLFTFKLVERQTGHVVGSLVAGCVFTFSSYRFTHYVHLHLLTTQWLPLTLLALDRFYERPTWARLAALGASGLLLATSSWQIALVGATASLIVAVWTLVGDPQQILRRIGLGSVAVLAVALAVWPLVGVYEHVSRWGVGTGPVDARTSALAVMSVPIEGLWTPGDSSKQPYLWANPDLLSESRTSPGIVTLGLAAVGVFALFRRRHGLGRGVDRVLRVAVWSSTLLLVGSVIAAATLPESSAVLALVRLASPVVIFGVVAGVASLRRAWLERASPRARRALVVNATLAVAGALLCLGPAVQVWQVPLGSGMLRTDLLPGLFRAPARFAVIMFLGLAGLAGAGAARLMRRPNGTRAAAMAGVLLVGINLDLWPTLPTLAVSPTRRAVHRWLDEYPEPGALIEYPFSQDMAIYASLMHHRRLVNGLGVLEPPGITDLREPEAFTPRHIETIWEYLHPRFVVFRGSLYSFADRVSRLALIERRPDVFRLIADFGVDRIYELIDRGRGPVIYRRWPREALSGRTTLELEARLVDVPVDAGPRLTVTLNGRPLLRQDGSRLVEPDRYAVRFTPDDLQSDLNTFEIRADYRRPDTGGHPIGTTGSTTSLDIDVRSAPDQAQVQVNGRVFEVDKGYLLVSLDRSGSEVERVGAFNTSWPTDDARRLASFVEELPEGAVVIVASEFDVSRHLDSAAVGALRTLGLQADLRNRFGWAHAAIGVKGAPTGSALESVGEGGVATLTVGSPVRPSVQLSSVDLY